MWAGAALANSWRTAKIVRGRSPHHRKSEARLWEARAWPCPEVASLYFYSHQGAGFDHPSRVWGWAPHSGRGRLHRPPPPVEVSAPPLVGICARSPTPFGRGVGGLAAPPPTPSECHHRPIWRASTAMRGGNWQAVPATRTNLGGRGYSPPSSI